MQDYCFKNVDTVSAGNVGQAKLVTALQSKLREHMQPGKHLPWLDHWLAGLQMHAMINVLAPAPPGRPPLPKVRNGASIAIAHGLCGMHVTTYAIDRTSDAVCTSLDIS